MVAQINGDDVMDKDELVRAQGHHEQPTKTPTLHSPLLFHFTHSCVWRLLTPLTLTLTSP